MRLLVLGGTGFAGRALVEEALRRGADVTVLNRGRRESPPGSTVLTGDRTRPDGLAALGSQTWDVVADTWSAAPYAVQNSARALARRAGFYAYVSSQSVYQWPAEAGSTEAAPLVDADPAAGSEGHGMAVPYAEAKRGAELAVLESFGGRALLARTGLILGPYEDIGRLTWWLRRIADGGDVPAPGPPDLGLQYIDVRDLAGWILDMSAGQREGAFNTISPTGFTSTAELLQVCAEVTGSSARFRWLSAEAITEAGVEPWTDLPIWASPGEMYDAVHRNDVSKALAAGLRCRPVRQTVQDTWDWMRSLPRDPPVRPDRPPVGLPAGAEARLLARSV